MELLYIVSAHRGVVCGRKGPEKVDGEHVDNLKGGLMCANKIDSGLFFTLLRIYRLREHSPVLGDILHHLLQRSPLHLLPLQVGEGVRHEVEEDAALTDLLDQQLLTISLVGLLQLRKLHQLPVLTDVEPKKSNQIWIGFACTLHNCTCFFPHRYWHFYGTCWSFDVFPSLYGWGQHTFKLYF